MVHRDWYQELLESQVSPQQAGNKIKNILVSVKVLEEAPEPDTSSDGNALERQQVSVLNSWSNTRIASNLQKLQREDPDIGPILEAKGVGKRPSSQDMASRSPACRHYWILWDLLVVFDRLLFKKFIKQDGSGE